MDLAVSTERAVDRPLAVLEHGPRIAVLERDFFKRWTTRIGASGTFGKEIDHGQVIRVARRLQRFLSPLAMSGS